MQPAQHLEPAGDGSRAANVVYIEGVRPGLIGRITQMHGEYYSTRWAKGCAFEAMVARELSDFCEAYTPGRDLLLTAHLNEVTVGSVAIDGSQSKQPGAQLRWFIVEGACRGLGVGRTLLQRAVSFCRDAGFSTIFLWTVEGLSESRRLYESVGFHVAEVVHDDRYSAAQNNLRMELDLRGDR